MFAEINAENGKQIAITAAVTLVIFLPVGFENKIGASAVAACSTLVFDLVSKVKDPRPKFKLSGNLDYRVFNYFA